MIQIKTLVVLLSVAWIAQIVSTYNYREDYDDSYSNKNENLETHKVSLRNHYSNENQSLANCQTEEVKSNISIGQEEYYDYGYGPRMRDIYSTYNYLTCTDVYLTPGKALTITNQPNNVTRIIFENTTIPLVPVGVFADFADLNELYLNDSSVNDIHPGAFTGLVKLKELYLQNNKIQKLSQGLFNSLSDLETLNLSNNAVESIENNTFLGLFAIQYLYINNNRLEKITVNIFQKLKTLKILDLSHNLLLNATLPSSLKTLAGLDLSYNKLTGVIDFLRLPKNLIMLNLSNNAINSIQQPWTLQFVEQLDLSNNNIGVNVFQTVRKTITNLNLSGNKIGELPKSVFNQSQSLRTLDISNNLLKNLDSDAFINTSSLTELFLQNNNFWTIPIGCFRSLRSLKVLNLSSNHITEFHFGTFSGLENLEDLDVSGNELAYLYDSSLHTLKNLRILKIQSNFINSFDAHELLFHAANLRSIGLDDNPWICRSLLDVVETFERSHVKILTGTTEKNAQHIHGIACSNDAKATVGPYLGKKEANASLAQLSAVSRELSLLRKFFDEDFPNSRFYKYFERITNGDWVGNVSNNDLNYENEKIKNVFNGGFKNTTFYKFFDGDLAKSSFFQNLYKGFANLSKELKSIDSNFKNSSLYEFINSKIVIRDFSAYFDKGFKNSTFYKYFNGEFSNSKFSRYFDKTLQSKINSSLLNLSNYFDNGFKNSSFYRFFNEDKINGFHSQFLTLNDSSAHSARYTDNSGQLEKESILTSELSKLSDIVKEQKETLETARVGNGIFMTIIIILLLAMTLLLAFKHFQGRFHRNFCKPASVTSESRIQISDAEIELV